MFVGEVLIKRVYDAPEPSDSYRAELDTSRALAEVEDARQRHHLITLVYAARHPHVNHARVLRAYLNDLEVPDVIVAN
jgi:uncharacterized protein YeaO (DUF488 family)